MSLDYRIISIGALAAHPLWNERGEVRTGHATTTLMQSGDANILVNPSLPSQVISARLHERAALRGEAITHVFSTSWAPDHRRGIGAFDHARWLLHEPERNAAIDAFESSRAEAQANEDHELAAALGQQAELVRRTHNAPQQIAPGVDLFPLPGVTAGTCGLILSLPAATVLLCGDAVATVEHLEQGKVLPNCADIEQAQDSFREAVEIADAMIPGRDNIVFNPLRRRI